MWNRGKYLIDCKLEHGGVAFISVTHFYGVLEILIMFQLLFSYLIWVIDKILFGYV